MNRSLALTLAVVSTLLATSSPAQDLMPPDVAARLGLTEVWARPITAPAGAQSIADQQLFVHETNPHEFVEIVALASGATAKPAPQPDAAAGAEAANADAPQGKVLVRIPTNRIGTNGKVLGLKEAQRLASNEIRRLKRRGIEATINVRTVPRVHLYSVSSDGTLESRDAETGEPIWMVRVGDRRLPYGAIGVNENYLSITNGANLIQVEAATGETIVEVATRGAPLFGAINSGEYAMIPMIGGGVEGYPLSDPTRDPFRELVEGNTLALPTKAPGSTRIAWGTDRGFVYVMEMQGTPSVLFRLNSDGIVSGRIASASGDRFFFGSEAGQIYALRATRSGTVLWSLPVGEPFYNEPMVTNDQLLIRSTYGNLFSIGIDSGIMSWDRPTPNVADLLGAFGDHIFITTLTGSLAVIDRESGKRVAAFNDVRPNRLLVNNLTDRLYLVSESGDVQCLKREGSDLPTFNIQPDVQPKTEAKEAPKAKPGTSPFDPGASDPFGAGGADPFGAGGADPFGADAGGAMDDPFGGGDDAGDMANPFGANPFGN
jgi:outer membrane protein assembly factor BamB